MKVLSEAGEFSLGSYRRKNGTALQLSAEQSRSILRILLEKVRRRPRDMDILARPTFRQIASPQDLDLLAGSLDFWDLKRIAGAWVSSSHLKDDRVGVNERIKNVLRSKLTPEQARSTICGNCGFAWTLTSFENARRWYICEGCHRTLCNECVRPGNANALPYFPFTSVACSGGCASFAP